MSVHKQIRALMTAWEAIPRKERPKALRQVIQDLDEADRAHSEAQAAKVNRKKVGRKKDDTLREKVRTLLLEDRTQKYIRELLGASSNVISDVTQELKAKGLWPVKKETGK